MPRFEAAAAQAPGMAEVLRHWRPDVPWIVLIGAAAIVYFRAARRAERLPVRLQHPHWKSSSFAAGLAVLALAVFSPIQHYGNQLLWANFLGFLLITMIAPPLLLLASPLTLAFRVAGPVGRKRLRFLYRNRVVRWFTFPIVSWLVFAVVTYLWQLTELTDTAARHAAVRDLQQITLLAVSLLFWLPALCADPVRWRMAYPLRGLYVFVEMSHKALFGTIFLALNHPVHGWFSSHVPEWGPSPILDQRLAILVLWIGGNMVFLAVLVGIIARWVAYEGRHARRVDIRMAREREAEERRRQALDQVFRRPV